MRYRSTVVMVVALVQVLVVSACSETGDNPFAPTPGGELLIGDYIASASVGNAPGALKQGFAPSAGSGPSATVAGNQVVVNGGTSALDVMADTPFTRVFVSLAGESLGLASGAAGGLGNYYEVVLPAPQTTVSLLLTFPQDLPTSAFDAFFSVADASGVVGPVATLTFDVLQVGTGDVQVTLAWDTDADVDLHVVDPNGDEVYWANRNVTSGGELDLDSNAGCSTDGVRNENITWPVGSAPQGTYTVRVDYWSSCGVTSTDYTVLVNNGGDIEVFSGTFTGPGDRGGAGSGLDITTFQRSAGPAATGRGGATRPPSVGPTTK